MPGKCKNCGGTGKIGCSCTGEKRSEPADSICPKCGGSGMQDCPSCKGSGMESL